MMLGLGLTIGLSACTNKAEDPKPEPDKHLNTAEITFITPTENATYTHGDTVKLNITAVGEQTLHGWQINIRNKADNTILFTKDAHAHAAILNIAEYWINDVHTHCNVEAEVIVGLDHDGNKASKKINFSCMP